LMVCRQGLEVDFIKVLDFGIAAPSPEFRSEAGTPPDSLEPGGMVMGTPAFMAPEATRGTAEPRSDLYALGCVGYWLVTGHRVFESSDHVEAIERHRRERPTPPSQGTEHEVSAELDAVILDCLEKDPARRPAKAAALAARLAGLPGHAWDQEQARAWWREHQRDRFTPTP